MTAEKQPGNHGEIIDAKPEIEVIEVNEIEPIVPEQDGTVLVLQRNAKDDREEGSATFGAILPEQAGATKNSAKDHFNAIFAELGPDEARNLDVMVLAGDATLTMETGQTSEHKRAVETAQLVIAGVLESFEENGIGRNQFLNAHEEESDARAFEVTELKDLKMMEESPEFVRYLVDKHGTGKEFWVTYEADLEKEKRLEMGVEGPEDIANRVNHFMSILAQTAEHHHKSNPGRRLVIWADSHYDSISPYVKQHIAGREGEDFLNAYCPIDYGAGVSITIDKDKNATTKLGNETIKLDL